MNKGLLALLAATALAATKTISNNTKGSFYIESVSDEDVFNIIGWSEKGVKSLNDFLNLSADKRHTLHTQAKFIITEFSTSSQSPLQGKEFTISDVVKLIKNGHKAIRKKIIKPAVAKSNKFLQRQAAVAEKKKKLTQFKKTEVSKKIQKIKMNPSVVYTEEDGIVSFDWSKKGLLEDIYTNPEFIVNPEAFVNYVRVMCCTYHPKFATFYKKNNQDLYEIIYSLDDSYVYNPLTDEYGYGVSEWAINSLKKLAYFQEVSNKFTMNPDKFTPNELALRYTWLNFHDHYIDQVLCADLMRRWESSNGKLNSVIMKQLHMLVLGSLLKMVTDYVNSELFAFMFFCDIGGQPLLPFGNCTFESYKELIDFRVSGEYQPAYTYTSIRIENQPLNKCIDGMGSLFDRFLHKAWSYMLKTLKDNETIRLSMSRGDLGLYFNIKYLTEEQCLEVYYKRNQNHPTHLRFWNSCDYKIYGDRDGGYPQDEFSAYLFVFCSEEFRRTVFPHHLTFLISNPFGLLGDNSVYGQRDPAEFAVDNLIDLRNKLPKLGTWASETTLETTRVVNSGQIDLAMYLFNPVLNFEYLDTEAEKYNLPLSLYPTAIKRKMDQQKKRAIQQKYVSPQESYMDGMAEIGRLRKVFSLILKRVKDIGIKRKYLFQDTLEKNLFKFLERPFNELLWLFEMSPVKDMDWGSPRKALNEKFVQKYSWRPEQGVNYGGHLVPYWILAKLELPDRKISKIRIPITSQMTEEQKVFAYRSSADDQTYVEISEGTYIPPKNGQIDKNGRLAIYRREDKEREDYYKTLSQQGVVKEIKKLINHLSKLYSVDSRVVSGASFNKIVGLVFGGNPANLVSEQNDYNPFINYYKFRVMDEKSPIPTQSLTKSGIKMIPYIQGLTKAESHRLFKSIRDQRGNARREIAQGNQREGAIAKITSKLIKSALLKQGIFGVPYSKALNVFNVTGIDINNYITNPLENLYIYSRNGEPSIMNMANANKFVPVNELMMVDIPKKQWANRKEVNPFLKNYIETINVAQELYLGGILQQVFSRFSSTTSNFDHLAELTDGNLHYYTKVKKVGSQLAILGDDPLGFREMYRSLSETSSSLVRPQSGNFEPLFDPGKFQAKEIAANSKLNVEQIEKLRSLIRNPMVQDLFDEKCEVDISSGGRMTFNGSPQPLEREILRNVALLIALDDARPSSRDSRSKQDKAEFYQKYDLVLNKVLADYQKINLLIELYSSVRRKYGRGFLPVADYQGITNSDFDINRLQWLVRRYKDAGFIKNFHGAVKDYPTMLKELVEAQQSEYDKGINASHEHFDSKFADFKKDYEDNYNTSVVAKETEKIGALATILNVGQGYRVYLPYKIEHVRNIARAGNKEHNYSTIVDINDTMTYVWSSGEGDYSVYCIADKGQHSRYVEPWLRGEILHFVIVDPSGDLHSLMTFSVNDQGMPSQIQQWRSNENIFEGQPAIMGESRYAALRNPQFKKGYMERYGMEPEEVLEVDSKIVREFSKFTNSWFRNPTLFGGYKVPKMQASEGAGGFSWSQKADSGRWNEDSKLIGLFDRLGDTKSEIDSRLDVGTIDSFEDKTRKGWYGNVFFNKTMGDPGFIEKYYGESNHPNGLTKKSDLLSDERKMRIAKLEEEGKL